MSGLIYFGVGLVAGYVIGGAFGVHLNGVLKRLLKHSSGHNVAPEAGDNLPINRNNAICSIIQDVGGEFNLQGVAAMPDSWDVIEYYNRRFGHGFLHIGSNAAAQQPFDDSANQRAQATNNHLNQDAWIANQKKRGGES